MSDYVVSATIGAVTFCIAAYYMRSRKARWINKPPGPSGVPLYGNLLDVKRDSVDSRGLLTAWAREYGDVYFLRFGNYDTIVLNNPDVIRDALLHHGDVTSGRSNNVFFFKRLVGSAGIAMNEGEDWKLTRRAALRSMREFGMGKTSLERRIQEEARALVEVFDAQGGSAFDPHMMLHNAFSNVICSIVFGKRYEYDDEEFVTAAQCLDCAFKAHGFKNPEMFVPLLTVLMPITNRAFFKAVRSMFALEKIIKEQIRKHRENFDPDDIKSFIDIYLKAEQEGELDNKHLQENMLASIFDLFIAGSETSATSLRWLLLYFLHYPDVQERCRREIKEVLGDARLPTNADRPKLPFVEATICELQRIATIAGYGVLHRVTSTLDLGGYTVPEDTLILPNLHALHMDSAYWGDPDVFRPQRWLDDQGELIKHDYYMPFGSGPRECPGKTLALQEIFIVTVALLQRFRFVPQDPHQLPEIRGEIGLTHVPDNFKLIAERI